MVANGEKSPVTGRLGDEPAISMPSPGTGLVVIVLESEDQEIRYKSFDKFVTFATDKSLSQLIEGHAARGIRQENFDETFRRYSKSLVAIGDGAGSDAPTGLKTEIVALANPYTDSLVTMPVLVLLNSAPRVNVQVELFGKAPDGTVTTTLHRTDANGQADLPITRGHSYLVNSVAAEALPNDDPDAGPVWKTHWAALSFAVPE